MTESNVASGNAHLRRTLGGNVHMSAAPLAQPPFKDKQPQAIAHTQRRSPSSASGASVDGGPAGRDHAASCSSVIETESTSFGRALLTAHRARHRQRQHQARAWAFE